MCLRVVLKSSWWLLGCKTAPQIPGSEVFCGFCSVCSMGGFFVGVFLMRGFKCWFLRAWPMILQFLFVNTETAASLSLPLCPRVYSVVKGKIYISTKEPVETLQDFAILEFSDYCWQMNAIKVLLLKNNFHSKICCKNTVVLSSLPACCIPNKVPNQKLCE